MTTKISDVPPYTGDVPLIGQGEAIFSGNAQNSLVFQADLPPNLNTSIGEMNQLGTEMEQLAQSSANSAATSASSANFKGAWSSLSGALAVPASVLHNDETWQLINDVANVAVSEPGVSSDWYLIKASDGYNVISNDVSIIDSEISQLDQSKNVVITGDSLSFNGFGYNPAWGVSGAAYATDNPNGMSSWAHMLRDLWLTCGFFQPISMSKFYTDCETFKSTLFGAQNVGINQKAVGFKFGTGDSLTVENTYTGGSSILISMAAAGSDVTFDINGTPASNLSLTGHYDSYEYMTVPFGVSGSVVIDNVVNLSGDAYILIYGIVPTSTVIPKLTGKGAWTSTQILDEYGTLVAPYNPNIIFYIIGANDCDLGDPDVSGYKTSVQSFINNARSYDSDCTIVLISMPATSSFTEDRIVEYLRAGRDIAMLNNCSHVDLYSATKDLKPSDWRYDNIHANTKGDTIWFNIFKKLLFPNANVESDKFLPVREAQLGLTTESISREPESQSFTLLCSASAPTVTSTNSSILSAIKATYETVGGQLACKVVAPAGFEIASISPVMISPSQILTTRQYIKTLSNDMSFRVTGINDNATNNPDGSGVYAYVTIVRDMSEI